LTPPSQFLPVEVLVTTVGAVELGGIEVETVVGKAMK